MLCRMQLAHVLLGSSAAFDLRGLQPADDPVEQACNRIAAEFLVPEAELREIWPKVQQDSEPVQSVARFFKVSQVVAARRALDLSILTKTQFFEFYDFYLRMSSAQELSAKQAEISGLPKICVSGESLV